MWQITESKRWVHSPSGRTASVYGAVPYYTEEEKYHWNIETTGYSFYNVRENTIHNFGKTWTKAAAEAHLVKLNNL